MGDIKSAREIAMEKIEKIGEPTEGERLKWKYVPEGEKIAAIYLKQDAELSAELSKYEKKVLPYVNAGVSDVLIKNITLPKEDTARRNNKRAMDGLKSIKIDKVAVENVFSKMRRLFTHYAEQGEQQKKQAYAALKAEFEAKVEQAVKQQLGTSAAGIRVDVEKQPQFQEEWYKMRTRFDAQYLKLLDEYKQELAAIS
ncbi:MAG: hypothetical protein Q8O16_01245 [Dehalococcoidia bacterium]|nr:hypothetical protein [Dehalococcoidia bacterium]